MTRTIRTGPLRRKRGTGVHPMPLTPTARRITPHLDRITHGRSTTPTKTIWTPGPVLDQGDVGACVGFGFTAELLAAPYPDTPTTSLGNQFGLHLYAHARHLIGWDTYTSEGTTMQSGAAACIDYGLFTDALWAQNIDDVRDAILTTGPVVIAIWFYPQLDDTDRANNFKPVPTTALADKTNLAGHCMCVIGYDPARTFTVNGTKVTKPAYFIRNSWGTSWGRRWWWTLNAKGKRVWHYGSTGGGWMAADQLATLLEDWGWDNGAACLPIGRTAVDIAAVLAAHPDPRA